MFNLVREDVERISRDTGFIQNSLEKILRLLDILNHLSKHPFLKKCFALKGGTALNVFYFNLPRLSVDADLNYIKDIKREVMLKDRSEIDRLIPEFFSEEYQVGISKKEYALSQFELRYQTLSGSMDRVKLDINYLHRQHLIELTNKEVNRFGLNFRFPLLGFEELFASKITAFLSRYTPRDLYDIYLVASSDILPDRSKLSQLIRYYGLIARENIFDLFNFNFDAITEYSIRRHLHPMLTGSNYPAFEEMKKIVQEYLTPLLQLNETERDVIEKFYASGDLAAGQLFPDIEICSKVEESPAFIWKQKNIKGTTKKID